MFSSEIFRFRGESKHRGSESSMICTIEFYSVASLLSGVATRRGTDYKCGHQKLCGNI